MMKLSPLILSAFLLAGSANAKCNLVKDLGTGSNLDVSGTDSSFSVAAGATTTCRTSCPLGSATNTKLYLRYGGQASVLVNDASDTNSGCGITLTLSNAKQQSTLGYEIKADSYNHLVLTCTCDNTVGAGSATLGGFCFSKDATVQVEGQGSVSMKNLQLGDKVLTGSGKYEPVYSFGHRNDKMAVDFLQIHTEGARKPLEMTGNHMVFKEGEAVRADTIKVGDILSSGAVTKIGTVIKQGLYMPLTEGGSIVVDGTLASSYVSIDKEAPSAIQNIKPFMNEQTLLQWWLSPFRMMCIGVSSNFCDASYSKEGILKYLTVGQKLAEFGDKQNFIVQHMIGFPLLFVFAFINGIESIFGASLAPSAILLAVAGLTWGIQKRRLESNSEVLKKEA